MSRRVLLLMILVMFSRVGLAAPPAKVASGPDTDLANVEAADDMPGGPVGDTSIMMTERIGDLRVGLTEKDVAKSLPGVPRKGPEDFQEADGMYVQDWTYADQGIELTMGSEKKGGPKTVQRLFISSPCKLKTKLGIGLGNTEEEVRKAYGAYEDKESSKKGEGFVAGSIYGGVSFSFTQGRVTQIFVGAAAE